MRSVPRMRRLTFVAFLWSAGFLSIAGVHGETIYVDGWWGSNAYDGVSSVVTTNGHGPKRNVSAGVSVAASNDTISAATGFYQEFTWDPTGSSVTLIPNGSVTIYDSDPATTDTDGDGMPDGWEAAHGMNAFDATGDNGADADPDDDELTNLQEYQYGTNPTVATVPDIVLNSGNQWTTNSTVTLDPLTFTYPYIKVALSALMTNAVLLANPGHAFSAAMPFTNATEQVLYFQYLSATTNAIGHVIGKFLGLDTIAPWVEVKSPTNNVTDQAFVHLRATVFDPDPQHPDSPGAFRPIKVWINGASYWNKHGSQIDIPRYPVIPNTNNVITVTVEDRAGNRSAASATVYCDPSTDTNGPTFSITGYPTNAVTVLPEMAEVWVSGQVDDLNAIMTTTVNGEDTITMNVRSNQFGYLLPLEWGTNTVTVIGSDAAGNTTSNAFTVVRSDRYRLAITSPAFGSFVNFSNVVVSGYVSALKDEGLPTATNVVAVTVNGVATTLGSVDGNGNRSFTTTSALPVPGDGSPVVLNVVAEWADGTTDPVAEMEGYLVTHKETSYDEEGHAEASGLWICGDDGWAEWTQHATFSFFCGNTMTSSEYAFSTDKMYVGCMATNIQESSTSNGWVAQPEAELKCGQEIDQSSGHSENTQDSSLVHRRWNGSITFTAPMHYPADTLVRLQFDNINYARDNYNVPADWTQVTFQGQPPFAPGSYLISVTGGQTYTIDASSFSWPGAVSKTWNYPDGNWWFTSSYTGDWFQFRGFHNQQILPDIDIDGVADDQGGLLSATATTTPRRGRRSSSRSLV